METNKNLPSMPTPPPDVMGDPIALLDCLEKNAGGITEQDSKGTAFLHVVPVSKNSYSKAHSASLVFIDNAAFLATSA